MDKALALVLSAIVLCVGVFFSVFPDRILKAAARGSRSYMPEEGLTSDPAFSWMLRVFGIAAIGLSVYMLYQIVQY